MNDLSLDAICVLLVAAVSTRILSTFDGTNSRHREASRRSCTRNGGEELLLFDVVLCVEYVLC